MVLCLEPGDNVGVAHVPLMRVPLDVLQHDSRAPGLSPGPPAATPISAVRYGFTYRNCGSCGLALACPARAFDSGTARFVLVWEQLSLHLRVVAFDLRGLDWTPLAIEQLGSSRRFADVFSNSKIDFGSCSLMTFEISFPEGSAPVISRPHRIKPNLAKGVDATLNQYLVADLIQQSTSPNSSPLVIIPKEPGGVRITTNYKKLNQISSLSQLHIPRVDQVLDSLGKGRVFSLVDLVSSSHQLTAHKDTVPPTAFCISTASMSGSPCPRAAALRPGGSSRLSTTLSRAWNRWRPTSTM